MIPQKRHAPSFHQPVLRLTNDPPATYDVAPPIDFAAAKAEDDRKFRDKIAAAFERHRRGMIGFLIRRFECEFWSAEDIVQDAFVKLLGMDHSRLDRPPGSFLFTLARAAFFNECQLRRRRKQIRWADRRSDRNPVIVDNGPMPDERAGYRELVDEINAIINQQRPIPAEELRMRIFRDMELREIALAHESKKTTVCCRMRAGLEELKRKFSDRMPTNKPIRLVRKKSAHWHWRMDRYVWCVELNKRFDRVADAAEHIECSPMNISAVLTGRTQTAKGYHFEWRLRPEGRRTISAESLKNIGGRTGGLANARQRDERDERSALALGIPSQL